MRRYLFLTVVLLEAVISSCAKKNRATEADVLGAWQNVAYGKRPSGELKWRMDDRARFLKIGNQLILTTYIGHYRAELNARGDSIHLRQGCMHYIWPLAYNRTSYANQDTLTLGVFGKFVRMNPQTFQQDHQAFIDDHISKSKRIARQAR